MIESLTEVRSQGAQVVEGGVRYRTWSARKRVEVLIVDVAGELQRELPMEPEDDGYFSVIDRQGKAGDHYRYRLGGGNSWPDPASRYQPRGVHEASMVIDPRTFVWSDHNWRSPSVDELVIYELHVGTFTREGTFLSLINKLDHIAKLGANAVELMPIADFPGDRNWGYDGVMLYAPARIYGRPDDLRAFVDAAHARGLAVIFDVVYNHFGPDGNYTSLYHPEYFDAERKTPWGDSFNLHCTAVRDFFVENAPYWMREFHADGFRLDATHEIFDQSPHHLLAEIAARVHELGGFVIAEDDRNNPQLLEPPSAGGFGLDACWSDDFHHVIRVMLTGEREGYYRNFNGTAEELAETIEHGWLYRGQKKTTDGEARGGSTATLQPAQFVYCISNHDQVGNRAFGERLSHVVGEESYRAASALLCLVPETPMLFMGQEWAASTPFQYFTDHARELGRQVTRGRRHEFRHFAAFADPVARENIPDPQAEQTFHASKLNWHDLDKPSHNGILALYRECLELRRNHPAFQRRSRGEFELRVIAPGCVALLIGKAKQRDSKAECVVFADLTGSVGFATVQQRAAELLDVTSYRVLFDSNAERFSGAGSADSQQRPVTVVFTAEA